MTRSQIRQEAILKLKDSMKPVRDYTNARRYAPAFHLENYPIILPEGLRDVVRFMPPHGYSRLFHSATNTASLSKVSYPVYIGWYNKGSGPTLVKVEMCLTIGKSEVWTFSMTAHTPGGRGAFEANALLASLSDSIPTVRNKNDADARTLIKLMEQLHLCPCSNARDKIHLRDNLRYFLGLTTYHKRDDNAVANHLAISVDEARRIPHDVTDTELDVYIQQHRNKMAYVRQQALNIMGNMDVINLY